MPHQPGLCLTAENQRDSSSEYETNPPAAAWQLQGTAMRPHQWYVCGQRPIQNAVKQTLVTPVGRQMGSTALGSIEQSCHLRAALQPQPQPQLQHRSSRAQGQLHSTSIATAAGPLPGSPCKCGCG